MFLMLTAQVTSQNPAWRDPAAYNHFSSTHHPCLPAKTTVPSTDVPGGPALLHNLATISSQKNKRARLSAPEDDDDFLVSYQLTQLVTGLCGSIGYML